jgi:TatD DNase family protein
MLPSSSNPLFIDTHCHLDAAEFDADRLHIAEQARQCGVSRILIPAVNAKGLARVVGLSHQADAVYALGIHPLYVDDAGDSDLDDLRHAVIAHRRDERFVAIGEIGLDHFVKGLDLDRQEQFFVAQLRLARELDLPVILHTRSSVDTVLKHLRQFRPRGGIAHAFNGSFQQASVFIDLGFKLGFGGAVTFDRALHLRRLARELPMEALVLETDAPDIPPYWLYKTAGQRKAGAIQDRNSPTELPGIAATVAQLRAVDLETLAQATSHNARQILGSGC